MTSVPPCFAGGGGEIGNISEKELIPLQKLEVITLGSREKAESFAGELEKSGYKTMIGPVDKGDYKVFILMDRKDQNVPDLSGYTLQGRADNNKPSWEILGRRQRNVHASLTLTGLYTDNALNSAGHKQSDFSTILSPAIWVLLPGSNQNFTPLTLSLRSPGGSYLTRQWPASLLRYEASLYYRADIPLTSSSGGLVYGRTTAQTLTGRFMLLGNRFSLLAEDQYEFSHLEQEAGVIMPEEPARYDSNLFNVALSYASRNRLVFGVGYSHFMTNYNSDLDNFRDRQDDALYARVEYKLSQKISLMGQYKYLNIAYDNSDELDSSEHYFMGGISWDITTKSKGLLLAGYGVKKLDRFSGNYESFSFEAQLDHRFTPKTSLLLSAYRKTTETDVIGMDFSLTDGLEVRLQHLLTPRLTTYAGLFIINEHYKKGPDFSDSADSTLYQVNLGLQYVFKRWLKGGIGYAYTTKDSSDPQLEYKSNTFYFTITTAI